MPNPIVRVTVDGTDYDLDFSDLTGIDAKDFRREVGIPLAAVLAETQDPDIDVIAGLVWLARRKTQPSLTYTEVAAGINFMMDMDINPLEETSSPEA